MLGSAMGAVSKPTRRPEQKTNSQHGGFAMNKSDLIEAVASELESSKAEASKMIEAVINAISDGLKSEEKVAISGFGTFTKKHRAARVGMNPATKEPIQIGESTTCSFKPSQHLKDSLHEPKPMAMQH
jgi:DNA-binding protein HU-beta